MAAVSATAATATVAAPAAPGSAAGVKVCFNSCCKHTVEKPQKGWRRRTGEFAELCDNCAAAYNDGKFCTTFHMDASGWRCCESCGKQIHCGCIVSFHMFVLLDAGGIECITCAKRSFIVTPNPAWPPPSLFLPLQAESFKDLSGKNCSPMAGSGPVPWHQAPTLFAGPIAESRQPKAPLPIDYDVLGGLDRLRLSEKLATSGSDKRKKEEPFGRLLSGGNLRISSSEVSGKGNSGTINGEQSTFSLNASKHSVVPGTSDFNLAMSPVCRYGKDDFLKVPRSYAEQPTQSLSTEKTPSTQNSATSSENVVRNGKAKGGRGVQFLPRYWPRISDEELQQISGDSNSVITPLFEKMLSASDAGRIGRLVLPKKCAEAYFPPISNPDGVPMEVQDMKGKNWDFHFRFWPNNNSRMYVLEGITPCIQQMQLQAGDVVTFSRIEPEGKLVMGCRKVSTNSSDQGDGSNGSNEHSASGDGKSGDPAVTIKMKKKRSPSLQLPARLPPLAPRPEINWSALPWSAVATPLPMVQEVLEPNLPFGTKRRKSSLGLKSKRLRIENEETLELKVTWEQVQGLFRPPADSTPKVSIIDGCEIEEYEDPPVIGRPTFPAADFRGQKFQWVQCENQRCGKWRKVPADAFLKARWTCAANLWDPRRSVCSVPQELPIDMLEDLLPTAGSGGSKRIQDLEQDPETVDALDGLDALANVALQVNTGLSPPSSLNRTKHPRHKPGCSCIVCIQPPSGNRPKHKPNCQCMVCKSMQRRVNTIMLKKERKQVLQRSHTANGNSDVGSSDLDKNSDDIVSDEDGPLNNSGEDGPSQFKGAIDLNTQPDKDEASSPKFRPKFCTWKKQSTIQPGMEEGQSRNYEPPVIHLDEGISINPSSAGGRGSRWDGAGAGAWSQFIKHRG